MRDFLAGEVLLIDKEVGWTSFDVVNKIRHAIRNHLGVRKIKVGHAGTLDPLATGLLIVCTGKKTKEIASIQSQFKEYTGTICLGATTASYDLETAPENFKSVDHITAEKINEALKKFQGEIAQKAPIFSAKRIDGKKAYDLARKGEKPIMKSNNITVYAFEMLSFDLPEIKFRVKCSKGTYIRSLANDLGDELGVGGYLKELRRTQIGEYAVEQAILVNHFAEKLKTIAPSNQA